MEPSVDRGGGGGQQDDDVALAAAFLQDLPAPWTAGRRTAQTLAPLLLDIATEQGWPLDHQLAAKLTENAGGINNYPAVLRKRIEDLPKRPTARQSGESTLPPWCGHCGDRHPLAAKNAELRLVEDEHGNRRPCKTCHPDHARNTT